MLVYSMKVKSLRDQCTSRRCQSSIETHFELVPSAKSRPPSGERHSEAIPYGLADVPPVGAVKSTLHSRDSGLMRREAFLRKSQSLMTLQTNSRNSQKYPQASVCKPAYPSADPALASRCS